jgi:DNA-directed RNA polymerase subunit L
MELNFIDDKKNRVVVEVKGEDHTFCNLLKEELWNDNSTKAAAYRIDHPLVRVPNLLVETTGDAARTVMKRACTRVNNQISKFKDSAKKILK